MVFTRSMKTDIKRTLTILFFPAIIILLVALVTYNAVFARTGMDIPVEINWSDQSSSSRPSSVTLRLMNGTTEVSNITLTSSDVDPSDNNKWVGVFASVPYNANYTVVEDSIPDYTISGNNASPNITNTSIVLDSHTGSDRNGTVQLGDANFVLIKSTTNNNRWYLWTLENYSGNKLTQLVNALKTATGDNSVSISTSYYSNSLPTTFTIYSLIILNETVTISGSEGNISYAHSYLATDRVSAFYYGNVAPASSSAVSITNTKNQTYNLTVHHLNEDNTTFAADTVTSYASGATYTASPIADNRYTPELTIGQATGIITQDTEVTYVYHPKFHDVIYQFTGSVQPQNASSLLPATVTYDDGDTVTVASEPTAAGYRFLGWTMNGQSVSGTFTMPSQNVTISGSWEQFNGYFSPSISKQITNPQSVYRYGDTVEFLITVSNPESYPITNVEVTENLVGANFLAHSGYTVSNTGDTATIASIPANGAVTLYAEFDIAEDVTQTLANTVEITAASADNYYFLDTSQTYIASVQFNTQSWQDVPVLTGVNTNGTILYFVLMFLGAIGIGGSIVVHQVNIKEREK
ncbi:Cna B-type domain-containing protein [Candidatus Saccharibacteria bacterium]|nr:Cna B-type domain-containing protein [Candidatus Saccharibacteria bacterium]